MPLTSIITVNFHQTKVTIALLESISRSYSADEVEIILVDNGAIKNQELIFHPYFGNIKYIQSKKNLGFAGGNNLGLKKAKGDYIFLLNNDTEIPSGCVEAMIARLASDQAIGLLSPLILYDDQKDLIQYAGFTEMNYLTGRNGNIGSFEKNIGQYDHKNYQVGYCHGAAVMCRKSDLVKVGLMDESYFLYYEELDWCERFKKFGLQIWFTGDTFIYHKESVSVGKESPIKTYFMTRNRMLFIRKNTTWINTAIFWLYFTLIASPKAMLKLIFSGQSSLAKWVWKGLVWNFTHNSNNRSLGFKII